MGPTVLFDKSFLQSLSEDESVWFDHFYLTNVCPLFYVETLADLEKSVREGRTPEQEVGIIASKFPEMHGTPCSHHRNAVFASLMGDCGLMTGRIPVSGGRVFGTEGKKGVIHDHPPEVDAFLRWRRGEFLEVERQHAHHWRQNLQTANRGVIAKGLRTAGINGSVYKNLAEVKNAVEIMVSNPKGRLRNFGRALNMLRIRPEDRAEIFRRWRNAGCIPFKEVAEYAAHVLSVDLFSHFAMAASLISPDRPSNFVDIAYLYYLPFCMVFVSSDHLHEKCAPLFLRNDQIFIRGQQLKNDLKKLNEHYAALPDAIKEAGIMSFAGEPPREGEFLTTEIWKKFRKYDHGAQSAMPTEIPAIDKALLDALRRRPNAGNTQSAFIPDNPDMIAIQRSVNHRKGSWWQVPKNLAR